MVYGLGLYWVSSPTNPLGKDQSGGAACTPGRFLPGSEDGFRGKGTVAHHSTLTILACKTTKGEEVVIKKYVRIPESIFFAFQPTQINLKKTPPFLGDYSSLNNEQKT